MVMSPQVCTTQPRIILFLSIYFQSTVTEEEKHFLTGTNKVQFKAIQAIPCFPVPIIPKRSLHSSSKCLPAALLSKWLPYFLDDKIKSRQLRVCSLTHTHTHAGSRTNTHTHAPVRAHTRTCTRTHTYSAKCLARRINN